MRNCSESGTLAGYDRSDFTRLYEAEVVYETKAVVLTGEALRGLQEDITIALLRRPTLGSTIKGAGIQERHFPRDLQPAFHVAMTKSQDEIRRLVMEGRQGTKPNAQPARL